MNPYTKTIQDILRTSRKKISTVNFHQYLTNKGEPAETISEMSPSHIDIRTKERKTTSRQRVNFRSIASKLRIEN